MVKELKTQAATHKYSCLDTVMGELKWWMMRLICDEDYELQLSDLGPATGIIQIFSLSILVNSLTSSLCRYGGW